MSFLFSLIFPEIDPKIPKLAETHNGVWFVVRPRERVKEGMERVNS